MNDNNGIVTITEDEYVRLLKRSAWLSCLENAGVDNWCGYEYAQELRAEAEGEN